MKLEVKTGWGKVETIEVGKIKRKETRFKVNSLRRNGSEWEDVRIYHGLHRD